MSNQQEETVNWASLAVAAVMALPFAIFFGWMLAQGLGVQLGIPEDVFTASFTAMSLGLGLVAVVVWERGGVRAF